MPDTYVKLPDGSYAQFPEGTSDADIESALKSFAEQAPASQAKPSDAAAPAATPYTPSLLTQTVKSGAGLVKDAASAAADMAMGDATRVRPATGAPIEESPTKAYMRGLVSGTGEGLSDYARGIVGGVMSLPVSAVRNVETLVGHKPGATQTRVLNALSYVPNTATGKLGGLIPLGAGLAYGVSELGALKTLLGLGGAVVGGEVAGTATDIALPESVSPEKRQAAIELAKIPGMFAGGAYAPRLANTETAQTLGGVAKGVTQGSLRDRLVAASKEKGLGDRALAFAMPKGVKAALAEPAASRASQVALERIGNGVTDLVGNYATASDENGVAWKLIKDSSVKKDYAAARKYIDTYVKAGQTPPPDLVTVFDGLREQLAVRSGETSASAYNDATRTLANAAREGAKSYEAAWKSLPMRMQALLRNVDSEMLDTLQMRSKNAGGKLGKPASDPWFDILNDVADESLLPQSVEVPPESPGGSATWTQPVEVVREGKSSAVSVDAPIARPEAVEPVGSHTVATRAARRGSTVGRPMAGFDSTVLEEARMLQDMSNQYERQEGLMGGPIDDAFMARFKQLSEKFLGTENRQKYDFKTKKTTPSLSTLNGAISNRFKFLPKPMKERLGLSKD